MDIISQVQDGNLWYFKVGGLASDGIYRVADLSRETTDPADWLAANGAEAQNAIDAGGVTLEESERGVATGAAQTGAKAWYLANPNAALLFDLSIDGLIAEIDSLDFAALPAATRNKLKLLLKTLSVAVRVLARREGLT